MINQSLDLKENSWFDRILIHLTTLMFILIFVSVVVQILARELPVQSSIGTVTEPLSRYLLIMGTYFGAAIATRNGEHVRMTFFVNQLETRFPTALKVIKLLGIVVTITFMVVVIYAATNRIDAVWGRVMGASVLDMGYLYAAIILSFVSMTIFEIINFRNILLDREE